MNVILVICFGAVLCSAITMATLEPQQHQNYAESLTFLSAVEEGDEAKVESMLKNGANVNSATRERQSALTIAVGKGNEKIFNLLIENGADVNLRDFYGFGPLNVAAQNGHKKMVEVLLKHGANVNATDEFNSIPLHNVREADVAIAKLLVNAGSNLEVKNIFNRTPLQQFNEDVLKELRATNATGQN